MIPIRLAPACSGCKLCPLEPIHRDIGRPSKVTLQAHSARIRHAPVVPVTAEEHLRVPACVACRILQSLAITHNVARTYLRMILDEYPNSRF